MLNQLSNIDAKNRLNRTTISQFIVNNTGLFYETRYRVTLTHRLLEYFAHRKISTRLFGDRISESYFTNESQALLGLARPPTFRMLMLPICTPIIVSSPIPPSHATHCSANCIVNSINVQQRVNGRQGSQRPTAHRFQRITSACVYRPKCFLVRSPNTILTDSFRTFDSRSNFHVGLLCANWDLDSQPVSLSRCC